MRLAPVAKPVPATSEPRGDDAPENCSPDSKPGIVSRNDVVVSADWAAEHLDDDAVVFIEVDDDTSAYDDGHLAGAVRLDWTTDLQDPVRRDLLSPQAFAGLTSAKGNHQRRHHHLVRRQQQLVRR